MAKEPRSYGGGKFSQYGYEASSGSDDGTNSSRDSAISDLDIFVDSGPEVCSDIELEIRKNMAPDVLERHGGYWDTRSIDDWNLKTVNYGIFIITGEYRTFVSGNFRVRKEPLALDFLDCRYGEDLGVESSHDYICISITGATFPDDLFENLSRYIIRASAPRMKRSREDSIDEAGPKRLRLSAGEQDVTESCVSVGLDA
ncbi:hypothetical protein CNYM01_14242 [Colletotrichum nymphaeae SA-01]|uniref:Uncharacterized protein n=1 Tax=Colletotrichum nymphaeae SA-01 TaxID=1460502 RepID=A0A135UUZ8_9PEZI|nr:hypothetical protein CNYM01_14242 [Colletotrichum nymphaeae SA-01]